MRGVKKKMEKKQENSPKSQENHQKEWKIDTFWMKFCFVLGTIGGFYVMVSFIVGFVMGILGLI